VRETSNKTFALPRLSVQWQ